MRLFSSQGGLELYALKLIEGLLKNGHRMTIICEQDHSALAHPNLTILKFAPPKTTWRKWQKIEHYRRVASDMVAASGPFDLVHSQHFPLEKLDVITFHNHTASRLSSVGYAFERLVNNFKLTTVKAYKLRFRYDQELCQKAAMRIFVAEVLKDDFYNTYELPSSAAFAIAPPGASLAQLEDGSQPTVSAISTQGYDGLGVSQAFTFLFVGKGFRKKGLDTLFAACKILKSRRCTYRLLIAGLKEKPLQRLQLAAQGISSAVTFLGYKKEMAPVYAQARVLVLPSKMEPFGMAPVQAMQYGLVPIVSQICGVAEVLEDGVDALILQNHLDARELADLMQKLIQNPDLCQKLSQQARISAGKITWEKTVAATEEAYRRIGSKREGASVDQIK